MQGEIICQHCGQKNTGNAAVCAVCMNPLFITCNSCNHQNAPTNKYCEECGHPLTKKGGSSQKQEAERRHLTVMFCDLVGSTSLSEQLDPEELREVVVAYQDVCAEAIDAMGGFIAQYLGDGILVYFGYPVAYEDDSVRAVRAALSILQRISALNAKWNAINKPQVAVRIGIHTGLAVIGEIGRGNKIDRLALGETPNIAARVQGLAEPGAIAISADTFRLIQKYFHCEHRGTHVLKGITTPMTIYQPFEKSDAAAVSAEIKFASPLIGREDVLEPLLAVWNRVLSNSEEVALVIGEAGIGKTHLFHEFLARIRPDAPLEIHGKCASLFKNNSFYPVTNILYHLAGIQSLLTEEEKLTRLENFFLQNNISPSEAISVLAPVHAIPFEGRYEATRLAAGLIKKKSFQLLKKLFAGLSKNSPVIFLLEDVQWADPSTLEFLSFLIENKGADRILYLFSFRPEFQSAWRQQQDLHHFEISHLSEDQVRIFSEHLAGGKKLPGELMQLIISKTDGVPLFIEELMRMILESGMVDFTEEGLKLKGPVRSLAIPSTLQELLIAKLDQLHEAKEVAQIGAVFGRDFTADVMQAISNLDLDALMNLLSKLVTSGLLIIKGEAPYLIFSFKHALMQEKAYQLMLKSKRQQYHQLVAEVLEKDFSAFSEANPEFMAHHYESAGKFAEAISYWRKAGTAALEKSAYQEAIAFFDRGLQHIDVLPGVNRDESEFYLQWGKAPALLNLRGYSHEETERTYARALELSDKIEVNPQQLSSILRGIWSHYVVKANHKEATRIARRLEKISDKLDDVLLAFEAGKAVGGNYFWRGEFQKAKKKLDVTLKKFDPEIFYRHIYLYSEHPLVSCFTYQSLTRWCLGDAAGSLASTKQGIDYARRLNHPFTLDYALGFSAVMFQLKRDIPNTLATATETEELGVKHGFAFWQGMASTLKNYALMEQGDEAALMNMEQALSNLRKSGLQLWISNPMGVMAEAFCKQKNFEKAFYYLNEAWLLVEKTGEYFYWAELHRIKGFLQEESGKPDNAEELYLEAKAIAVRQGARYFELRATIDLARLWSEREKRKDAIKMMKDLLKEFDELDETPDIVKGKAVLRELESVAVPRV